VGVKEGTEIFSALAGTSAVDRLGISINILTCEDFFPLSKPIEARVFEV
jgi:hypothetical protein